MAKDIIIKGMLEDRSIKFIAISGRALVEKARVTHGLSRVCTAALGRTLMVTDMMGAMLKYDADKLSTIVKGGGPAGNIVCTAQNRGTVKGYIEEPATELPLAPDGKLDVALAVGWFGELVVVRDLHMKEPYVGRVEMVSGEIAEDFARYFAISEQQPSLVYLGVHVDKDTGETLSAGGIIIQPMPNCDPCVITKLEACADGIKALSGMLEKLELEAALSQLLSDLDMEITDSMTPEFKCDCSKRRLESVLISLGRQELTDMIEKDHGAELSCHFCNTVYSFSSDELVNLLKEAEDSYADK